MGTAVLTVDLSALRANWKALNAKSAGITAAVVKADGYGLDSARVASALAAEGAPVSYTHLTLPTILLV